MKTIIGNTTKSEKEWKEFYGKMDLDGDGQISFDEFISAAIDSRSLMIQSNIQEVFNMIDVDHDGYLTKEELEQSFAGGQHDKKSHDTFGALLKDLDKDNDGKVSFKEFHQEMTNIIRNTLKKKI